MDNKFLSLYNSVKLAKTELHNMRNEVRRICACHEEEMMGLLTALRSWKSDGCLVSAPTVDTSKETRCQSETATNSKELAFRVIGVVSSDFVEKRGTPRQASVSASKAKITLFNSVFTNPQHALQGLHEFSHMWVLYHFHRVEGSHIRAKVAPPRLNGARTGVFGTRSPHRPSPIGLSLVHIDRVEGWSVHFSGVDMLDGTPVLDLKPYIPQYDDPMNIGGAEWWAATGGSGDLEEEEVVMIGVDKMNAIDPRQVIREAPEGEETSPSSSSSSSISSANNSHQVEVRIPEWISSNCGTGGDLKVSFAEKAMAWLNSWQGGDDNDEGYSAEQLEATIRSVLRQDPRSVYVRGRYANQFYTFLIAGCHVGCKFDDVSRSVLVYRIHRATFLPSSVSASASASAVSDQ